MLNQRSAYVLEGELDRLSDEGFAGITLDLRELAEIDATGVAVVVFRCQLCQRRGCAFELIRGPRGVHRAFEQAGVAELLPFRDDPQPAAGAPTAPAPVVGGSATGTM